MLKVLDSYPRVSSRVPSFGCRVYGKCLGFRFLGFGFTFWGLGFQGVGVQSGRTCQKAAL